jgi:hypothetical protein
MGELNSEQLKFYHDRIDRLKKALDGNWPRFIVGQFALDVAKLAFGGKAEMCRHFLNLERINRGEFTPEEDAEMESMAEYERLQDKRQLEQLRSDYTPNLSLDFIYTDRKILAERLYMAALEGENEKFDEVFEGAMMHRYEKAVVRVDGERTAVWRKVRSLDDSDEIITGY